MNTQRIVERIISLGQTPVGVANLNEWSDVTTHVDIHDYLTSCVTDDGLDASGIGILGRSQLNEENNEGVSPGGRIRKYGFIAIAVSVGGNAVVLSSRDGHVYWADHSSFSDTVEVSYEDRKTGEWQYLPWSLENVFKALVLLSNSVETFLIDLLSDKLNDRFEELD